MKRLLPFFAFAVSVKAALPSAFLIISDDQHWGDYGFMGHPQI
jgi:hypothetical protein